MEEYMERVRALGNGDVEQFARVKQPAYINGNVYLNGADVFDRESGYYKSDENPDSSAIRLEEDLTGAARAKQPKAGPIEGLHEGKNRIKIWTKRSV